MKVCDAHTHVGEDYYSYHVKKIKRCKFNVDDLIKVMDENNVEKSICALPPSIKEISSCCDSANIVKKGRKIITQCPKCGKVMAELEHDPYRKYNLEIAEEVERKGLKDRLIVFFNLHLLNPFIEEEIKFFKDNFKNFGFKLYPSCIFGGSILTVKDSLLKISIPLLIHSGADEKASPKNTIQLAREYKGKILMAHLARFSSKYLSEINKIPNLFVDTSPVTSYYNKIKNKDFGRFLENPELLEEINKPEDIYDYALNFCSPDKILFGTDVPWCDEFGLGYNKEVEILRNLNIEEESKEKIAYKNFEQFLTTRV